MLSRAELQGKLRERLEKLTRERMRLEEDKAASNRAYGESIKQVSEKIGTVLEELETGQGTLPLDDESGDRPDPETVAAQAEAIQAAQNERDLDSALGQEE